jgi:hypothetical protein
MKIAGRKIEGPNVETLVIPRGEDEPIVFKAQAVLDYDPIEKLLPLPAPPVKIMRGGKKVKDTEAQSYKEAQQTYAERRLAWIILQSLAATPELEWETVDMDNPETWPNFEDELRAAGFSAVEINRIIQVCMQANCLDESKLEQARKDFLASLEEPTDQSSSPTGEQKNTQSGELANDLE